MRSTITIRTCHKDGDTKGMNATTLHVLLRDTCCLFDELRDGLRLTVHLFISLCQLEGLANCFFWLVMSHNKSTYMYVSVSIPSNNDRNNEYITSILLVFSTYHGVVFSSSLQTGSVYRGAHLKLSDNGKRTVKRLRTKGERSRC
jgi:hypothetical protein